MTKQLEDRTASVQQEFNIIENYTSTNVRARPKTISYKINEIGCWVCTSHAKSKNRGNYPVIRRFDKYMRLSRYIYWLYNGDIDRDKYVMHMCDNPECINPNHLELGTPKENSQDMVRKGRNKTGIKHPDSKLTESDVLEIYESTDSCIELATIFNVSKKSILNIRHKRTYKKEIDSAFPNDTRWSKKNEKEDE